MQKKFIIFIGIICFNSCTIPTDGDPPIDLGPDYSHEDSVEAQQIAFWYAGTVAAPEDLRTRVMNDLWTIRNTVPDSLNPIVSPRFLPPWIIGNLLVGFDDSTAQAVADGIYTGWELLPDTLQPDTITDEIYPSLGIFLVGIDTIYNPLIVAQYYDPLPGVQFAEPDGVAFLEGTFPLFPRPAEPYCAYVFVENYTYLPSGYHYFEVINDDSVYHDFWNHLEEDEPEWWTVIDTVVNNFYQWYGPGG